MMAEPSATPSLDDDAAQADAMNIVLRLDAILAGQRFKAGAVLAVAPSLLHLALQLIAAGVAIPAAD